MGGIKKENINLDSKTLKEIDALPKCRRQNLGPITAKEKKNILEYIKDKSMTFKKGHQYHKRKNRDMTFCATCSEDIKIKEAIKGKKTENDFCSKKCMSVFED